MKVKFQLFILLTILFMAGGAKAQSLPCPTGQTCGGSVTFTVTFQAPNAPASVSPTVAVAGSSTPLTLTLTAQGGSTFNNTMTVLACQQTPTPCATATALTTTFVSASSLTATFPVAMLANSGTFAIYIEQPAAAHAQNEAPTELFALSDRVACLTCEAFPPEVLTTVDRISAVKL